MKCLLCNTEINKVKFICKMDALKDIWKGFASVEEELKLENLLLYQCDKCTLQFFDPRLAGGNRFYSELGQLDWYYLHPGKTEYDFVQSYIKDGDELLDVGSGRGELFKRTKKRIKYTGLELSSKAVELAQKEDINVNNEDLIEHAKSNSWKYDIVTLFQVLEHLTELDRFIGAIHSVLKSGGLFFIAVPNNDGFPGYTPNYTFNLPPHHTILWKKSSLKKLAEKFNFEIVEIVPEVLQEVHRNNAYDAYIERIVRRFSFMPVELVKTSKPTTIYRLIKRISSMPLINKLLYRYTMTKLRDGQTIIAVLRKK
jgi:2-polyprenyl-3-methyl-5-hydroxy-6-metoxy-1,4-benzoquinol methylase